MFKEVLGKAKGSGFFENEVTDDVNGQVQNM